MGGEETEGAEGGSWGVIRADQEGAGVRRKKYKQIKSCLLLFAMFSYKYQTLAAATNITCREMGETVFE